MPWGAPFSVYYNIFFEKIMKVDDLFDQCGLVAVKRKGCIRERGFTKASFARKAGISRPELLDGNVDNERVLDDYASKALVALNISINDLIDFEPRLRPADAVCRKSVPEEYQMSTKARKQYGLLMDILELCEIYY